LESTSTTITPEALTGDRDVKLKGIETVLIQETGANADNPVSLAGKEPASDVPQATAFSGNNEPPAEFETGEKVFVEEAGVVLSETEPDELIDVSFLDKNKWQIRKEKDIEHFNFERVRRETSDTVKEMKNGNDSGFADKDSRSSDKSRSGIAGEFSLANMKEKIRHSGPEKIAMEFNREQFKNSLNELVRHAKLNIVENGKSTAQISLNPKELGKLTLNISVLKDTIEGKIFVESETIKNLIMSDLNLLKNELKAAGLNLEILQVEVRQESFADGFLDSEKKFRESMEKNDRAISGKQNAETADDEFISQRNSSRNLIDIKV
ncbi:MAG: flagellar hook-length control protein FliK, partial [Leptospira sp.]|nr:flagellar hook-length control protein FliK [Leptospira sp.]